MWLIEHENMEPETGSHFHANSYDPGVDGWVKFVKVEVQRDRTDYGNGATPTQWAYDQACRALNKCKEERDAALERIKDLGDEIKALYAAQRRCSLEPNQ
jgi:hypothetical protein